MTKPFKPYIGQLQTARQLIRHRNIMLGLPITKLPIAIIPYGYEQDPDNEDWLIPVQKELEALYLARTMKPRASYEKLAKWISEETGRKISWESFRTICRYRPPLATYLLTLDERLQIATAPNEEKAIELQPVNAKWSNRKNLKATAKYLEAREKAVARKEKARGIKRS